MDGMTVETKVAQTAAMKVELRVQTLVGYLVVTMACLLVDVMAVMTVVMWAAMMDQMMVVT